MGRQAVQLNPNGSIARYACKECDRTDLSLTANSRIRSHTANGKRRTEDNPNCPGGSDYPRDPSVDKVKCSCGEWWPDMEEAGGYGHTLEVCGPATPRPDSIEDPSTAAENGAVVHVIQVADCRQCRDDLHACLDCGDSVDHGVTRCEDCKRPVIVDVPLPPSESGSAAFFMGTAHEAADGDQDAMDALMAEDRPSDGTDQLYRNGRYALPDPITGVARTWTRATTMAETVSDLYSLNLWKIRMTLIGVTRFPDLLDELREIDEQDTEEGEGNLSPKVHREVLNRVGLKAQDLAGAKVPASWGTDMHTCIERLSRDEITVEEVPKKYRREVSAWAAAMSAHDLSAVPHLIERRIAVPLYGVAGTLDQIDRVHRSRSVRLGSKIVGLNAGDHLVGDVKSGRDLDYGWGEISIQMSIYAQGIRLGKVAVWNPDTEDGEGAWEWEDSGIPPKSVRTDVGVVMHVPIGGGQCTLHWIDLEEGWKAVQLCEAVRDWRRAKGLHTPFSIAEVPTTEEAVVVDPKPRVRTPSWLERFSGVTTREQAREVYRAYLAAGGSKGTNLDRLIRLAKEHLDQLAEESA